MVIIDVSDPNKPNYAGRYEIDFSASNIFINENYVYMVNPSGPSSGLYIIDIGDPINPIYAGSYFIGSKNGLTGALTISNNYFYIGYTDINYALLGIDVIDISDQAVLSRYIAILTLAS